jgi:hypothetical protein
MAPLFPKADCVLPSLWQQINGSADDNWAIRGPDGSFIRWTDEMGFMWRAKDELPARGLACVGKHVARVTACVAPGVVPLLVATASGEAPEGLDLEVVEAVREHGPLTGPELREHTRGTKKDVDKAVVRLQRSMVLTHHALVEQEHGWGAIAFELVERKWPLPALLPERADALAELARLVLAAAGEVTAADLGGVLGLRIKAARAVLDSVADSREEDGYRIWVHS